MKQDNKNIFASVSSGYSSVLMAVKLREWYPDHNIIFGMANPTKERPESLEFMQQCVERFDIPLQYVQATISPRKGKGNGFELVNFADLLRNGEIFEKGVIKYGIPNPINKWCTRDLKTRPLEKYANSIFGKDNYSIAIGIRTDELDRISKNYKNNNIFYPLIEHGVDSAYRNKFWSEQDVQIKIPAFKGNCDLCFKKSKRKKLTIIQQEPERAVWWDEIERKYSLVAVPGKKLYNTYIESGEGIYFARENESLQELVKQAQDFTNLATDEYKYENDELDAEDDCGVVCEPFN